MPAPLGRALQVQGGGELLPVAFPAYHRLGITPRRGQLTMFFGHPGAGKTFLALLWALKMGVPTLFFSLDTDAGTMAVRAASAAKGMTQAAADSLGRVELGRILGELPIQWCFSAEATPEDIDLELRAYIEMLGQAPELIVIDNLMNVTAGDESEWAGMRSLMKAFHALCRESGAAVWVLHHAGEGAAPVDVCPPRSAIQGKVSQLPELIVSVGMRPSGQFSGAVELGAAVVKNRRGKADPAARNALWLPVDIESMRIFEEPWQAMSHYRQREYA